ncbi:hypothetical protein U0070_000644 [Myodes glareolus]|uniref:Uncharacterized protein n=1 Tax=Myodes glareolus TaxID=447135 RepID=A0AAW0IH36_MYOGA
MAQFHVPQPDFTHCVAVDNSELLLPTPKSLGDKLLQAVFQILQPALVSTIRLTEERAGTKIKKPQLSLVDCLLPLGNHL